MNGAVVYFILGATRSLEFKDDKGTAVSMNCESGDLISVEGELATIMPFDVGTLPMDLPNHQTGIQAITYVLRLRWSQDHVCSFGGDQCTFANLPAFPERIPAWTQFGVLGDEIEAKPSEIDGGGLGLFLLKDFPSGGPVTEYDGSLRSHAKVVGKRDQGFNLRTSHWRSLPGCDFVIEGISQGHGLFNGRGGASLANHKPGNQANAKFEIVWSERERIPRFCEDDGCFHVVPRIILSLLAPAKKGAEIFVDYGEDTAKRFMETNPANVLNGVGSKVGECLFHEREFFDNNDVNMAAEGGTHLPIVQLRNNELVESQTEVVSRIIYT